MFKVSKWLYQSTPHDRIISKWCRATASLVAKNATKKLSQPFEVGFWCSRCLNDSVEVPDMIGSFASGTTASLVAKIGAKNYLSCLKTDFDVLGV